MTYKDPQVQTHFLWTESKKQRRKICRKFKENMQIRGKSPFKKIQELISFIRDYLEKRTKLETIEF